MFAFLVKFCHFLPPSGYSTYSLPRPAETWYAAFALYRESNPAMDKPESKRCPGIHPFYFPAPGSSGWSGRVLHHQLIQVVWVGRQQWSIKPVAGTRTPRDATLAGTPVHLRPDRLRACFFRMRFLTRSGILPSCKPLCTAAGT